MTARLTVILTRSLPLEINMTEPMDPIYVELRQRYPQLPESYWRGLQEQDKLRAQRDALRAGLIHLIGFHDRDGAVPLDKLRALLDDTKPGTSCSEDDRRG